MHHLVVGGNGLLGRHLVRALSAKGYRVSVVDIAKSAHGFYEKVPFYRSDITVPTQLANLRALNGLGIGLMDAHPCYWACPSDTGLSAGKRRPHGIGTQLTNVQVWRSRIAMGGKSITP